MAAPSAPPAASADRWSFIWRPPSGTVCPECFFPLARYVRRLKWIRTFSAGMVLLVVALMLFIVSLLNPPGTGAATAARVVALVGGVVFLIGVGGVVIGGRHAPDDQPSP